MKLGVIGSGKIVQEFLPELITLDHLEIHGILSTPRSREKTEKLAAENGIKTVVTEFDELKKLPIDTVYIAAPNHLHFKYAKEALEAGLNVIVEKPIASSIAEAEKLKKLAEEKNLFLFEAMSVTSLDSFFKVKDWLPEIGKVHAVNCQYLQYSSRYDAFLQGTILPAFDPEKSGGALMDLGVYPLHFVLGLFGKPQKSTYYPVVEKGIDTAGTMVLQYPFFTAVCTAAKNCDGPGGCMIAGEKGVITTQLPPNRIGKVFLKLRNGEEETFTPSPVSRIIPQFERFIRCMETNNRQEAKELLDLSVEVNSIQTAARLQNGLLSKNAE